MISFVRKFLTLTPSLRCFSSSLPSHPIPPPVVVWWDMENCVVPKVVNHSVADSIKEAVRSVGIEGTIQIRGFGNLDAMASGKIPWLSSGGIKLHHVPEDGEGKVSAVSALKSDLMSWARYNRPPAHLFLISGDRDFAPLLHRMRRLNYNILLATNALFRTHVILSSAASIVFDWRKLVRRENLIARYFNQPPINLWYDYYEGPLENPFTIFESKEIFYNPERDEYDLSQDSIWTAMQEFLNSDLGIVLIGLSRTRGQMGCFLLKYGPSILNDFSDSDILQMIHILIQEKKWVQESPHIWPFKITPSARITLSTEKDG